MADQDFSWVHATPEKIFSPAAEQLMAVVRLDPSPPSVEYEWSWGGTVTIVTVGGERFTSTVDAPRGSAPRGIEWSDTEAKYRALMPDSGPSHEPHRGGAPDRPGSRRAGLARRADRTACLTARVHQGGRRRPSRSPVEDR